MLHTKSQSQWPFGSREEDIKRVFTIYGRHTGGHLSHVTITICINCDRGKIGLIALQLTFMNLCLFMLKKVPGS